MTFWKTTWAFVLGNVIFTAMGISAIAILGAIQHGVIRVPGFNI